MPATLFHIYTAEKIAQAANIPKSNEYLLGSIAPDCFFFDHRYVKLSRILHGSQGQDTAGIVFELLENAKTEADLAFTLGYLAHCATDMVWHPMIYYFSGKSHGERIVRRHHKIETALEMHAKDVALPNPDLTKIEELGVFARLLQDDAYTIMTKLLKRQLRLQKVFRSDAWYQVAKILKPVFNPAPGFLGLFHKEALGLPEPLVYKDPITGKQINTGFDELLTINIGKGQQMLYAANKYSKNQITKKSCQAVLKGESLMTGRKGLGLKSMKFFSH